MHPAPLLEEKGDLPSVAGFLDEIYPGLLHRARAVSAFPSDNRPIDARNIEFSEILK